MTFIFGQPEVSGASGASASASVPPRPTVRSRNDEVVMSYMKTRIEKLEKELKDAHDKLDMLKSRPAPSSEREDYLIGS